ncbi:MAG: putative toxin-antitoxin system toxin component, PIN family [Bacteroidetes bacterium]|nr:putative toxin-antitoxin system toxin component, PIN family [Bacteroidota bacterium]
MYFIFDTNTLISAILKPLGTPNLALSIARQKGKLVFCKETKDELIRVVSRNKFEKYLAFDLRIEIALSIIEGAEMRKIDSSPKIECRDPKDEIFLRLALRGDIDCIISGDIHLKEIDPFYNIPILPPSKFIDWIRRININVNK